MWGRQASEGSAVGDKAKKEEITKRRRDAARRALVEAEGRRRERSPEPPSLREIGGRKGPDPTRFGDWEKDGIAVDF